MNILNNPNIDRAERALVVYQFTLVSQILIFCQPELVEGDEYHIAFEKLRLKAFLKAKA